MLVSVPFFPTANKGDIAFRSTLTPDFLPTFILILLSWVLPAQRAWEGGVLLKSWGERDRWLGAHRSSSAPGGDVEAGDHHEMGLAEVDTALQALRHALQGLQVLQGIQLQDLFQVN